jgi:hypothetical protein
MKRKLSVLGLLAAATMLPAADAGVTGLKAFYREGQTFLTWQEDAAASGEWYRVYASGEQITAANLSAAKLVAKIPEGSNHFAFLRNVNVSRRGFFQELAKAKWYRAIQIEDDPDGARQLPDGTGLFVRTIKRPAATYYAVTVETDGAEDKAVEPGGNSLTRPIREKVDTPGAVLLQKLGDRHFMYAIFCDYELWNPDGVEDNWEGYVHVFNIRAPSPKRRDTAEPYPASFRLHAYSAWGDWLGAYCYPGTHVDVRMLDYHLTWWYGYSDRLPRTLERSKVPPAGTIVNFSERRVLQVARWLATGPKNFPFKVDPQRFSVFGGSMGGTGTHYVGLRNGDLFAGAGADKGIMNWALSKKHNPWAHGIHRIWGPHDRNDPTNEGERVFDLLNLPKWVAAHPEKEMPFLDTANGIIDTVIPFHSVVDYWDGLEAGRHPYAAAWDMVGHASWLGSGSVMSYRRVRLDEVIPAFANASCNTPLRSGFRICTTAAEISANTVRIKAGQIRDSAGINVKGSFPPDLAGKTLVLGPSGINHRTFTIQSNTPTELTIKDGDLTDYLPPLTGWDLHVLKSQIRKAEGKAREPTDQEKHTKAQKKKRYVLICDGAPRGQRNALLAWSTRLQNFDPKRTEDDIVDEPRRLAICIRLGKTRRHGEWPEPTATADVTPRRARRFRPAPGETVRWENWDHSDPDRPKKIGEGEVTADAHGLVTVPKFVIGKAGWGNRLVLLRK